ncbi:MAG: hypothetical protein D6741_05570, partial [Planctomycetota bacterium]
MRYTSALLFGIALATIAAAQDAPWPRTRLPDPNVGSQQTCAVAADFDGDGRCDFAVGERTRAPA